MLGGMLGGNYVNGKYDRWDLCQLGSMTVGNYAGWEVCWVETLLLVINNAVMDYSALCLLGENYKIALQYNAVCILVESYSQDYSAMKFVCWVKPMLMISGQCIMYNKIC